MKTEPRRLMGADRQQVERAFVARVQSDPDARECLIPFHENGSVEAFVRCYQERKDARAGGRS